MTYDTADDYVEISLSVIRDAAYMVEIWNVNVIFVENIVMELVIHQKVKIVSLKTETCHGATLHWRHNDHDGVSNHQPDGCLLNRLFRRRSKKISKLHVTGFCGGIHRGPVNSPHKWPVIRKMFPFDDVIMKHCNGTLLVIHQKVKVVSLKTETCHGARFVITGGSWVSGLMMTSTNRCYKKSS